MTSVTACCSKIQLDMAVARQAEWLQFGTPHAGSETEWLSATPGIAIVDALSGSAQAMNCIKPL